MKKILSLLLVLALTLCLLAPAAFAADSPQILVSSASAAAGDTVTLDVSLANNPGIIGMTLWFEYDPAQLQLTAITPNTAVLPGTWQVATGVTWAGSAGDSTANGCILTLTFQVTTTATPGSTTVAVGSSICNNNLDDVPFTCLPGTVTIGQAAPLEPDITGSGVTAAAGAAVQPPVGGWAEGENTFTVSCDSPCVVAVSQDGGATYTLVPASNATETGASFTAAVTADTTIAVLVRGDTNNDGKVTVADIARLKAHQLGKTTLDPLTMLAAETNGNPGLTVADIARLKAVQLGKAEMSW